MKVLYIASNPPDENSLLLEREITQLQSRFGSRSSAELSFVFLPGLPLERIPDAIAEHKPDILHLSAHGNKDGLVMLSEEKKPKHLTASALKAFLDLDLPPRLVIINACNSKDIAGALVAVVPMAIGMVAEISNSAARAAIRLLYERLIRGQSVKRSFEACRQMAETIDNKIASANLYTREKDLDSQFFLVSPQMVARLIRRNGKWFKVKVGLIGCPGNTHQVVFFTDDPSFADDHDMTRIASGPSVDGEMWTEDEDEWVVYGDFRLFGCGVTADGSTFTATSSLTEALERFERLVSGRKTLPPSLQSAIDDLRSMGGSYLTQQRKKKVSSLNLATMKHSPAKKNAASVKRKQQT
jgi:hypothetical protein